ncbi:MAG TPA: serine hydrolase [Chthoniobacterales bacterium]
MKRTFSSHQQLWRRVLFIHSCLIVATLIAGIVSQALAAESSHSLSGLWVGEEIVAAAVHGEVTIDGQRPEWRSVVAGVEAKADPGSDPVYHVFRFPADTGELRVHSLASTKKLAAFWIQPANAVNNNRYATPIKVSAVGENRWQGVVRPLASRLSLFLSIQETPDGSMLAVIRNPEANLFRRNSYRVDVSGNTVILSDTKDASKKLEGSLNEKEDRLSLRFTNLDKIIQFKRCKAETAVGFFPRVPREPRYVYRKPVMDNDGWETASLAEVKMDAKPITGLIEKILESDPLNNALNIQSLLIARHGKLVLEEYFYGFDKERPHDMRSASKTFAPMLLGIAHELGAKIGPETPVYSQFPEDKEFANQDPRKAKMTARDLMTMTGGLACDDNDDESPGNEDNMQQQKEQPNWYKYTLDLPLQRDPGGDKAVYCSAGMNLIGGMVKHATSRWLPEFFDESVADPLQFQTYHWNLMPSGDGYAAGGLQLRPRDELKLGQLYLAGGVWKGRRVVSRDWVERSTARHSSFEPAFGVDHEYGYGWHLYHLKSADHSYRVYAAGGNGGQIVMVIPELDVVVGFNGGSYGEFPKWYKWQTELVPQFIIPAAVAKP